MKTRLEGYLSIREFSQVTGLTYDQVRVRIHTGIIRDYKHIGHHYHVSEKEIELCKSREQAKEKLKYAEGVAS